MNRQQRVLHQQQVVFEREREEKSLVKLNLSCAAGFWDAYCKRPGGPRRRALLALFRRHPTSPLPVNNRWQCNTVDPDLQQLLKKGLLVRERSGGGRRNPKNRSSGKRQTYLVLAT